MSMVAAQQNDTFTVTVKTAADLEVGDVVFFEFAFFTILKLETERQSMFAMDFSTGLQTEEVVDLVFITYYGIHGRQPAFPGTHFAVVVSNGDGVPDTVPEGWS